MFGKKNEPVRLIHNDWGSFIKIPNDGFFWNKHHTYFVLSSADDLDLTEDGVFCTTFVNYPVEKMLKTVAGIFGVSKTAVRVQMKSRGLLMSDREYEKKYGKIQVVV